MGIRGGQVGADLVWAWGGGGWGRWWREKSDEGEMRRVESVEVKCEEVGGGCVFVGKGVRIVGGMGGRWMCDGRGGGLDPQDGG